MHETWNRLLLVCNLGQFSFILCAASGTLPTAVNVEANYTLCGCTQLTTAHALSGCLSALPQDRFTYHHNKVVHCLTTEFSTELSMVSVYRNVCK